MPFSTAFLFCADFPMEVGRFDVSSLPDQTLLELLVGGFKNKNVFYDDDESLKDISTLTGVAISSGDRITTIDYGGHRLEGTLQFKYFPPNLRRIRLWGNGFSGEFSACLIPLSTYVIYIGQNALTGSVVVADLSDSLVAISLFDNSLSGTLDFQRMPVKLISFDVFGNKISGSLDFSSIERIIAFEEPEDLANLVWQGDEVDDDVIYFEIGENSEIKGDARVFSLEKIRDYQLLSDTGITGFVDRTGKKKVL